MSEAHKALTAYPKPEIDAITTGNGVQICARQWKAAER
jgi:hypothetical protein